MWTFGEVLGESVATSFRIQCPMAHFTTFLEILICLQQTEDRYIKSILLFLWLCSCAPKTLIGSSTSLSYWLGQTVAKIQDADTAAISEVQKHKTKTTEKQQTVVMLLAFIFIIISIPSPLTLLFQTYNLSFLQLLPTVAFLFFFTTYIRSLSANSHIWYSITHSLFLSRLKTFLLYKSFPL